MKSNSILNDLETAMSQDDLELGEISLSETTDAKNTAAAKLNALLEKYFPEITLQDKIFGACLELANVYGQEAFSTGARFGARMILELLSDAG